MEAKAPRPREWIWGGLGGAGPIRPRDSRGSESLGEGVVGIGEVFLLRWEGSWRLWGLDFAAWSREEIDRSRVWRLLRLSSL